MNSLLNRTVYRWAARAGRPEDLLEGRRGWVIVLGIYAVSGISAFLLPALGAPFLTAVPVSVGIFVSGWVGVFLTMECNMRYEPALDGAGRI